MASLEAFASTRPPRGGRPCWVCTIPEREEIDAAKRDGKATARQMVEWLRDDRGHAGATAPKLNNHFNRDHHRQPAAPPEKPKGRGR